MSGNVVMMIPAKGSGHNQWAFEAVAVELKKQFYPNAVIVYVSVTQSADGNQVVSRYSADGRTFDWNSISDVSRVLTISHAGVDGPIFGYMDAMVGGALQPWADLKSPFGPGHLSREGRAFFHNLGQRMLKDGRIIFLGCNIAKFGFPSAVGAVSGVKHIYAPSHEFAAGDITTVVAAVRKVEAKAATGSKGKALRTAP